MKYILAAFLIATVSTSPINLKYENKVNSGDYAYSGQFPYQVSVQYGLFGFYSHVCGGAIITSEWIITAGHCYTDYIHLPVINGYRIVAGTTDLSYLTGAQVIKVGINDTVVHPAYQGGLGPNDIALMKLTTPLSFNMYVQSIKLPTSEYTPSGNVLISGWSSKSKLLEYAELPLITYSECQEALTVANGTSDPLDESNFCASANAKGASVCKGDYGSPIVQDETIVGVASWTVEPCYDSAAPFVFVEISKFLDFITTNVTDLP